MTGSSTRMLPLLLLLVIFFCQSSSLPCRSKTSNMQEFQNTVKRLSAGVQDCSENCSSTPITVNLLDKCKCLNLTESKKEFRPYFLDGLKSLHNNSNDDIRSLIMAVDCIPDDCQVSQEYDAIVSPKVFFKKLETLAQQINSNYASS